MVKLLHFLFGITHSCIIVHKRRANRGCDLNDGYNGRGPAESVHPVVVLLMAIWEDGAAING